MYKVCSVVLALLFCGTPFGFAQTVEIGNGSLIWGYPFHTFNYDARVTVLYTAQEIGSAGYINSLALDITTEIPSDVQGFKIRFKHTDRTELSVAEGFDIEGWVIAFDGSWPAGSGWQSVDMDYPYYYNGSDNLLVDIIIDRDQWWYSSYGCRATASNVVRSLAVHCDNCTVGDPQVWCSLQGPTPLGELKMPNIRFELSSRSHYEKLDVMCFNIRGGYNTEDDPRDNWSEPPVGQVQRKFRVLEMILSETETSGVQGADIIGLQEVWDKNGQVTDVINGLDEKYAWSGIADNGTMSFNLGKSYVPILYKKDRFNCLDQGVFWLSETPDVPSTHSDTTYTRIATWVILYDKKVARNYFVLNTHLDHISATARGYGAKLIMSRLEQLADSLPVIVMGDMNSYEKPTNNQAYIAFTSALSDCSLIDCFRTTYPMEMPMERTFGTWNGLVEGDRIDFIFARDMVCRGNTIERKQLYGRCPSDHYPVIATFYVPKDNLSDINKDSVVDVTDFVVFGQEWLRCAQTFTCSSINNGLLTCVGFDMPGADYQCRNNGVVNSVASFNGFDEYIQIDTNFSGGETYQQTLSDWTVAFWINLDRIPYRTTAAYYMMNIIGGTEKKAGGIQIAIRDNARVRLEVYSEDYGGLSTYYNNTEFDTCHWYHLVVSYSVVSGQVEFYLDGESDGEVSVANLPLCWMGPLYIGKYKTDRFLDGMLDEMRIYDRQLSLSEIQYLAAGGSTVGSITDRLDLPGNFYDCPFSDAVIDLYDFSYFCWYLGQDWLK